MPPVCQQLEQQCSKSRAALAVMYRHAKQKLEDQTEQLSIQEEALQQQNAQLQQLLYEQKQQQLQDQEQLLLLLLRSRIRTNTSHWCCSVNRNRANAVLLIWCLLSYQ
jgi:hypothetical protein